MTDAVLPTPQTPPATPPAAKVVTYKPKDPAAFGRILVIALWVDLGIDALNFVADVVELPFAGHDEDSPLPGQAMATMLQGLAGLLQFVIFLVVGFMCLKWVYRMSLNAHAVASDMKITPGWGVGWFFVPFACLWKPFQGVRESWQVSAAAGPDWQTQPVPPLLRWWWGLWLVSNIIGNIGLRLQMVDQDMAGVASVFTLLQDLLNVPLDYVFILMVQRLTTMQVNMLSQRVFE